MDTVQPFDHLCLFNCKLLTRLPLLVRGKLSSDDSGAYTFHLFEPAHIHMFTQVLQQ
jgi:hypothetical protein